MVYNTHWLPLFFFSNSYSMCSVHPLLCGVDFTTQLSMILTHLEKKVKHTHVVWHFFVQLPFSPEVIVNTQKSSMT